MLLILAMTPWGVIGLVFGFMAEQQMSWTVVLMALLFLVFQCLWGWLWSFSNKRWFRKAKFNGGRIGDAPWWLEP